MFARHSSAAAALPPPGGADVGKNADFCVFTGLVLLILVSGLLILAETELKPYKSCVFLEALPPPAQAAAACGGEPSEKRADTELTERREAKT